MRDLMATAGAHDEGGCSICLESTVGNCDRTIVRLRCSHVFHLDCIGSAFNAARAMQCPNCRQLENGTWRRFPYHHIQDFFEEWTDEDEEDPLRFDPRRPFRFHPSLFDQRARRVIVPPEIGGPTVEPLTFIPIISEGSASDGIRRHHPFGQPHTYDITSDDDVAPIPLEPSAPMDHSVGPLFSFDQSGPSHARNGPMYKVLLSTPTVPVSARLSSEAAAVNASSPAAGSSSNSFPMPSRDDHFRWGRPYSKSPSPAVTSMVSGIRCACHEFHGNKGSSSSQQTTGDNIFHAGAGGSLSGPAAFGLIPQRHGGSSSEQLEDWFDEWLGATRCADPAEFFSKQKMVFDSSSGKATKDVTNVASTSFSSSNNDNPEDATVHDHAAAASASASETHDNRNAAGESNFEYPLDEMDPSYSPMEQ